MQRISAIFAVLGAGLILTTPAWAIPTLEVTANHLGGGLIQYTLMGTNDIGGSAAVQITAENPVGAIHQIPTTHFPDAPPDGGADLLIGQVDVAQMLDPAYLAAGGQTHDSWYDNTVLTTSTPFFNTIIADGAVAGFVGSPKFAFSSASPAASGAEFPIGQIVILDAAAAGFPTGPLPTTISGGFAQMDIVDVSGAPSIIKAGSMSFPITGSFFVIPEPSSMALLGIGLTGLLAYRWRRRRQV